MVRRLWAVLVGAACLLLANGAWAACGNPAWLTAAPPGFAATSCNASAWGTMDVALAAGTKTVEGGWSTVEFAHQDGSPAVTGAAVRDAVAAAAKAAGGAAVSPPDDQEHLVLKGSGPAGDIYYIFEQRGSDDNATGFGLTTLTAGPLKQEVEARELSGPLAMDGPCADPPWLVKSLGTFKREDCSARVWVQQTLEGLPSGTRTLEGRRVEVSYTLRDDTNVPTGIAVQRNFLAAFKAIGATIVSAEDDTDRVVATQTTPAGETWYLYGSGGGNSDRRSSYVLTTFVIAPMPQEVQTQALTGPLPSGGGVCADPPWLVKSLSLFTRQDCDAQDWTKETLGSLPGGSRTLEGKRQSVNYALADGNKVPTGAMVQRNFLAAFKAMGAQILSAEDDGDLVAAMMATPKQETWYLYQSGGGNADGRSSYTLTTFVIAPFVQEVAAKILAAKPSTDAPCADPGWVVKPLGYFKVGSCEGRDWDMVDIGHIADGDRHVEGVRVSVNYVVADPARVPPGELVQRNFLAALKAIGATILSPDDDADRVVANQATPAGATWYLYEAGGGNADARSSYTLTTLVEAPFVQEVAVRAMAEAGVEAPGKDCADPPWLVHQFAAYDLRGCDYQDFAPLTLKLPEGDKTLAGRVLETTYGLTDPRHDKLEVAVWRNYVNALQGIGATLVTDPKDTTLAVLGQKVGPADYWYIYRKSGGNLESTGGYELDTLVVGGPPPKTCTIEIYGVNFDFDKAVLRPESEPVLQQVLALFTGTPDFAAEVSGHTDNIGKPDYNLKLSDARAAAVKTWLVSHGVAAARMTSRGYGDTHPLVPNTTDANRFKNRRVELHRANCK